MEAVLLTTKRISWLEKVLTDEDYVEVMAALAARAIRRLSRTTPKTSKFHVVASVEDFELLALPIVMELKQLGHAAVTSCVWARRETIGTDRQTMIAPIIVSVDEAPFDSRKHLILVSSCVDTTAVLESMLTHAHPSPDFEYERISVIAPVVAEGARREFKQALPRQNADTYKWLGLFQVPQAAAVRLKELFTEKTALALGLDNSDALLRHMPAKILGQFDDTPKSTPGLSM